MKAKAVFFDRDGTVLRAILENGEPRPPRNIKEFHESSGVVAGTHDLIGEIKSRGFLAILVTNQPDISYGKISSEDFNYIQGHVEGIPFDDIFICFHKRDDGCLCKKPKPGMLITAAKKWGIDLESSYFVGDTQNDVLAARQAGCKVILINGEHNADLDTDFRIESLSQVVNCIT